MKFLPESRKKQIWSLLLLVISVAGIVYINFFRSSAKPTRLTEAEILRTAPPAVDEEEVAVPVARPSDLAPSGSGAQFGRLLPFGAKIDLSVLEEEAFQALRSSPSFQVSDEELGKSNLFGE